MCLWNTWQLSIKFNDLETKIKWQVNSAVDLYEQILFSVKRKKKNIQWQKEMAFIYFLLKNSDF